MSLNHIVISNPYPLDVKFKDTLIEGDAQFDGNVEIDGTLTVDGKVFAPPSSGSYVPAVVTATNGVVVAGGVGVQYMRIGNVVKLSYQANLTFGAVAANSETVILEVSCLPDTHVSGNLIYGVGSGGGPTLFGTGITPPLVGVYPGTPTLTTVSMEFRRSDNAILAATQLPSEVQFEITYTNTLNP
jgi:hypothetical protein